MTNSAREVRPGDILQVTRWRTNVCRELNVGDFAYVTLGPHKNVLIQYRSNRQLGRTLKLNIKHFSYLYSFMIVNNNPKELLRSKILSKGL